jgi:hypothetical protein
VAVLAEVLVEVLVEVLARLAARALVNQPSTSTTSAEPLRLHSVT